VGYFDGKSRFFVYTPIFVLCKCVTTQKRNCFLIQSNFFPHSTVEANYLNTFSSATQPPPPVTVEEEERKC